MPNDPFITEMDPVLKIYMFNHWVQDQQDKMELLKDHAYLLGSFHNPEAVSKLLNADTIQTSDEDFDKATEKLLAGKFDSLKIPDVKGKRNRKIRK